MNKSKLTSFFKILNTINNAQNKQMHDFVSPANKQARIDLDFQWDNESLFDYVDLKFDEITPSLRNDKEKDDNTLDLIKPINDLIAKFNKREIDYYEFMLQYKMLENNLQEARNSKKYFVLSEDFESKYSESSISTITGVGGIGKSHFLWKCQNRIQANDLYKSLFLYGKFLNGCNISIPWETICEYANQKEFLLVIDGINEIHNQERRKTIYNKIFTLSKCKFIRIFVSYRTGSLLNPLNDKTEASFLDELLINKKHFTGVDFESSIASIVTNSKVDVSCFYHLLYTNNPMIIRMLIESDILNSPCLYNDLKNRSIVNMTFIYERFIKTACKKLWGKNQNLYWNTIKDICKRLFDSNRLYFTEYDIDSKQINVELFINDLENGGYIIPTEDGKFYFMWEQLSNNLIARSILVEISNKTDDEIYDLFIKKANDFPAITQFLIAALVDKFHENFDRFISFMKKVRPTIETSTLLDTTIINVSDRIKLQQYVPIQNMWEFFTSFCGTPNRIYNCESFFFEHICESGHGLIKSPLYFNREELIRKLKFNLHNINGKYFDNNNKIEFLQFAILCLLIPDSDIIELSEKTIFDLIELCDYDFSGTIYYALDKINSPLLKRSIYNVICHLSHRKQQHYTKIICAIEKDKAFVNAKVLTNFCKHFKLQPYAYAYFDKTNLFTCYKESIPEIEAGFDEFSSLDGLISIMRLEKMFYSLNMEFYKDLQLNYKLFDEPARKDIIKFNKRINTFVEQHNNNCKCNINCYDGMFDSLFAAVDKPQNYDLVNQKDLFFGFVAHLMHTLKLYGIDKDDIKWYKNNRYQLRKLYPDNITMLLTICVEEYVGSLMCNYFQNKCTFSYCGKKLYLGYAPIMYDETQINLCSPVYSYNETIGDLDISVIERQMNINV